MTPSTIRRLDLGLCLGLALLLLTPLALSCSAEGRSELADGPGTVAPALTEPAPRVAEPRLDPVAEPDLPEACSSIPGVCEVCIQPLGTVPPKHVQLVADAISTTYGVSVRTLTATPLPDSAWYAPRKRYRAGTLLEFLAHRRPSDCDRVVGLTVKDISVTKGEHKDWGILGYGSSVNNSCVVSSFRVRRKLGEVPPEERLARVAIHELGHTLGLPHCPNYGCFMQDAGGTVETIDTETELCGACQRRLDWVGEPPPTR